MAISPRRPCSAWHPGLSWKAWVSFVSFEPCVEVNLARLSLGSRLAHQPWCALRARQSFQTISARQASVALGPWLSRETYFSWGTLRPRGPTKSCCVTDEAAVSFLPFFSNLARQPWLPWNSGGALDPWRPRLAFHDSICVARLSRGPGRPRGAREPIPSAWSWQRCARKALFTFLASFPWESRSSDLPWYRKAWRAWLALQSWETFGAWLSSQPWGARVPPLSFFSQGSWADCNSRWAWRTCFTLVSLETFVAWGSRVPRVAWKAWTPFFSFFAIFSRFSSGPWLSGLPFLSKSWHSLKSRFTFLTLFSFGGKVSFFFNLSLSRHSRRPTDPLVTLITFWPLKT